MTSPASRKQPLLSRPRRLIVSAGAAALLAAALPVAAQAAIVPHVTAPKTVTPTVVAASASQTPAAAGPATSAAPTAPTASAPTASAPADSPAPAPVQPGGANQPSFGTGSIEDLGHLSGNPYKNKNNSRTAAEIQQAIQRAREFADAITTLSDTRPGPILPPLPEPKPEAEGFFHEFFCMVLNFALRNNKVSNPNNGAKCL